MGYLYNKFFYQITMPMEFIINGSDHGIELGGSANVITAAGF